MARFDMHITALGKLPLRAIKAKDGTAYLEVEDSGVTLRLGVYEEHFAPEEITGAAPVDWPLHYGIGGKMTEDSVGFVTSTEKVVRMSLKAPRAFKLAPGIEVTRDGVCVSVQDPDGLIAALSA